jgi:prophage regulatory protein
VAEKHIKLKLTAQLHRRLSAIADAGVLGRTVDEVVTHFTREALHRDWLTQEVERDREPKPTPPPPRPVGRPRVSEPLPTPPQPTGKRLLRLREVCSRIGVSRSKLYSMSKAGEFPEPARLGGRTVAWVESEIEAWIDARSADRGR